MQTFTLYESFITLGQLLKELGFIPTGGAAKYFLAETPVLYNGQPEKRRGKKLYVNDHLEIPSESLSLTFVAASVAERKVREAKNIEKARLRALTKEMNMKNNSISSAKLSFNPQNHGSVAQPANRDRSQSHMPKLPFKK